MKGKSWVEYCMNFKGSTFIKNVYIENGHKKSIVTRNLCMFYCAFDIFRIPMWRRQCEEQMNALVNKWLPSSSARKNGKWEISFRKQAKEDHLTKKFLTKTFYASLTLLRMGLFGAAHFSLKSVRHIVQWWDLVQLYLT